MSTFLGLTKDQLRDIAMGVSRGFQAYNPDNPLASAGAAMEGSLLSGLERERRTEDRQFQLEDESRAAKEKRDFFDFQLGAKRSDDAERAKMARDQEKQSREDMIASGVHAISEGPDDFDVAFSQMWGDRVPRVNKDGSVTKPRKYAGSGTQGSVPSYVDGIETMDQPLAVVDETVARGGVPFRKRSQDLPAGPSPSRGSVEQDPILDLADAAEGMISDEGDIESVMDGVKDGDPVGLESYDLGFAGDGTPVLIFGKDKKTVVPVGKDMWMALMSQRKQMRAEIRDRAMFAAEVAKAKEAFAKIRAAVPSLKGPVGDAIDALIEMDPRAGTVAYQRALMGMESDGGKAVHADVRSDMQKRVNEQKLGWLLRAKGKQAVPNPQGFGPPIMQDTPSIRDEQIEAAKRSKRSDADVGILAWQRIDEMVLDPAFRRMNPNGNFGFVETHLMTGRDVVSNMSALSRLEFLAESGVWGEAVRRMPVPTDVNDAKGKADYLRYLQALDGWAAEAFGWDGGSSGTALAAVVEMRVNEAARQAGLAAQKQTQQESTPTPQARSRPRI